MKFVWHPVIHLVLAPATPHHSEESVSNTSVHFQLRTLNAVLRGLGILAYSVCVQTSSEAHPAFYPIGRGSFLGG
jgi:hypothetical protein